MNQFIMKEWLTEFYAYIGSERCVVLLMDNFSAHEASVEQHPPLQNIRIVWLPANSTSRYQPLDQGIINSLKAHYRRYWLEYIVTRYENLQDPLKSMQVRFA